MAEPFDRTSLSQRENEILDLAIEGMTDQQIAHRLSISASTVNSYWVRIRGKLGPLSRTELVARSLREKARIELVQLQAQKDHFEKLAGLRREEDGNAARASFYRAVLDGFLEAVLAVGENGDIVYVNDLLAERFGYRPEDLVGVPFLTLIATREQEAYRIRLESYFRAPYPIRLGIGKVIYGRRRDGYNFRVVLCMNGCQTPEGTTTTCIVRDMMEEVDLARRHAAALLENLLHPATSEEAALRTELR